MAVHAGPGRRFALWSLALHGSLALLATYPLILHLRSRIPAGSDPAPALRNLWALHWTGSQVLRSPLELLDANTFYPLPRSLALGATLVPEALLSLPGGLLSRSLALPYNLAFLATLVLSGVAVQLLVGTLTGSRSAGLVTGLAAVVAPFRYELITRLEYQALGWTALSLWLLLRLLDGPSWPRALALGLGLAAALLSCLGLGSLALGCVAVVAFFELVRRRLWLQWSVCAGLGGALAGALFLAWPFASAQLQYLATEAQQPPPEAYVPELTPVSWLPPANGLPWRLLPWPGQRSALSVSPGVVLLLLALAGLVLTLHGLRQGRRRTPLPWSLLALGAATLTLRGHEQPPSLLGRLLPPGLLLPLMCLACAVLAGFCLVWLEERLGARARPVLVLLVGLLLLESLGIPLELTPIAPSAVHRHLAALETELPVVELPMNSGAAVNALWMAQSAVHRKPLINGYGPLLPAAQRDLAETADTFPDLRSLAAFMQRGAGLVILHTDRYPPAELRTLDTRLEPLAPWVREQVRFEDAILYELDSSFEARQQVAKLSLQTIPPLPDLQGPPCFGPGEELVYELDVGGVLEPATVRVRVLPAPHPAQLVIRLELEPTALGRRFLPGSFELEDVVRRRDLESRGQLLLLRDRSGLSRVSSVIRQEDGRTLLRINDQPPRRLPGLAVTPLAALFRGRCLEGRKGDRFSLGLIASGAYQEALVNVGGEEEVPWREGTLRCRRVTLEPGGRGPLRGGHVSLWISSDERRLPLRLTVTPPAGFVSFSARLVDATAGAPPRAQAPGATP